MVGLCRCCASLRKVDALITIKNDSNEICEKLRKCCQLNIKMSDALPKSICQDCLKAVNSSYGFYSKVKDAQETLKALYPSHNVHEEVEQEGEAPQTSFVKTSAVSTDNSQHNPTESNVPKRKECKNVENTLKQIKYENYLLMQAKDVPKGSEAENNIECKNSKQNVTQKLCIPPITQEQTTVGNSEEYIEDIEENVGDDYFQYQIIHDQQEQLMEEEYVLDDNNSRNQSDDSNEDDLHPDGVVKQINEMISDNEIDIEVEYMEYYDEDEEENQITNNKDNDQSLSDIVQNNDLSSLPAQLKINSWKSYKFLCFICNDLFLAFTDLKSHIAQEHNITQIDKFQYKCYDCKKFIPRYNFFLNHIRSQHHPDLKLKCDVCDLSCQNFQELSHHRGVKCAAAKSHAHIAACNKCFKSFHNVYGLQNHIKFQHDSSIAKTKFKCKQCSKEFQYKSCLKSHEKMHKDTKKYSCNYCDRSFFSKYGLEQHLNVHIDEKIYQCNICNKRYKTFQSLDEHHKIHTEEKAFQCQFCDKCFRTKIQKITHERVHTGEMPYPCHQCYKRFRYSSALFAHSKIHTGSKPYSCDYCSKTFADSSNRNKHVKRMHRNEIKN